jgi:D-alanyl-D-alanine carboxypeptidase
VFNHATHNDQHVLRARSLDGCLLLAEKQGKLAGAAGIDLNHGTISEFLVAAGHLQSTVADSLLAGIERLALGFGVLDLRVSVTTGSTPWFLSRAYRPACAPTAPGYCGDGAALQVLVRSLRRRQTHYGRLVAAIGNELGIPRNYGQQHRLQMQYEASRLESIGLDVFGREQWMAPGAATAWQRMRLAAAVNGIELQAVSAWRSVSYQQALLQRKLEKGLAIDAILQVSAAPGYSEHHTGRAIDITSPACAALSEEFAQSPEFRWLQRHAPGYGFELSFPRRNRHKLAYEPWHWCFGN